MKLVLPILFFALFMGMAARRTTRLFWFVVGTFVALMIAYAYVKPL
jgi:hypothetical protein